MIYLGMIVYLPKFKANTYVVYVCTYNVNVDAMWRIALHLYTALMWRNPGRNLPLNIYFSLVTVFVQGNSTTRAVGFEHATHYTIWKELPARHHKLERLMDELPWAPKEQGLDFGDDGGRF